MAGRGRGEKTLLCLTCNRVRPALSPEEYTVLRAHLITIYGLCTCTQPGPWMPERPADTAVACDSRETRG